MLAIRGTCRGPRPISNLCIFSQSSCKAKGDLKVKKKVKDSFDNSFPGVLFISFSNHCLNVIQIHFIALS